MTKRDDFIEALSAQVGQNSLQSFIADLDALLAEARVPVERVLAEVRNWPAADFWHRDAILRAIAAEPPS